MDTTVANPEVLNTEARKEPIAPWWHTVAILAGVAGLSAASAHEHGLPNFHLPVVNPRLSSYLTVILAEWLLVMMIWIPLKLRGRTLGSVVSGRWPSPLAFFRDLGLAVGFFIAVAIPISLVADHFSAHAGDSATMASLPRTVFELGVWIAMSATAGFCEEFIFRGYLMEQFSAWTGRRWLGIAGQAICFGLGHAYYSKGVIFAITFLGLFLGLLSQWRRSLRPGMLFHGMQDSLGGIAGFLMHR